MHRTEAEQQHCSDSTAANGPMQCKRQCKQRKMEELGHTRKKRRKRWKGWDGGRKADAPVAVPPTAPLRRLVGMKKMTEATDSGRKSAKRDSRNNREFVISPRQRRTFAKEKDREDRDDVLEPLYWLTSLDTVESHGTPHRWDEGQRRVDKSVDEKWKRRIGCMERGRWPLSDG